MSGVWSDDIVTRLSEVYAEHADPGRATAMRAYMKDVAPFCGIPADDRRRLMRAVWRQLPAPEESDAVAGAAALRALPEREFHYAAAETLGRWRRLLHPDRLDTDVRAALLHVPWWDTVDLLGSAVVNPMVAAHPDLVDVMWQWNADDDLWLIRASIQHQRGAKHPDIELLLALCAPHTSDRRFYVAKAIGWALRDASKHDPQAVASFVAQHPELPPVAYREARRGIDRAMAAAPTLSGRSAGREV